MPDPTPFYRGRAVRRAWWPLAALLAACPACHSVDAKVHNLGELHNDDGKVSYKAALMGDSEYVMRRAFSASAPFGIEFDFQNKDPELIEDPSEACLQELLALERYSPSHSRYLALRTEMYAWLATGDPYVLARERCVLELAEIGQRLQLDAPMENPAESEQPSVEELTQRITDLIQTAAPLVGAGERTTELTLAEACDAISALKLGIPAGRRVLRTSAVLLSSSKSGAREFDPLRQLVFDVARRLTAIALGEARNDSSPTVRAAAVLAWTHATDNRAGELMVAAMGDSEPLVVHRLFQEVAAHGIPRPMAELDEDERAAWKENWIANLVRMAREHPDGKVSVAACKALTVVSDAGFESLRFEDWVRWWVEREAARVGDDRVLKADA